jgi:5'(3')-deoxyribonucleotidase
MRKPKISKIYVDLDGVLADFDKRFVELYKIQPEEADHEKKFKPLFADFIKTRQFSTLELMPDAHYGIDYLNSLPIPVEILSSTARPDVHEDIKAQKIEWLKKFNISYKPNLVPGKKHKQDYATEDSILIDDLDKNIEQWIAAGGFGILHKNWVTTLAILKLYI